MVIFFFLTILRNSIRNNDSRVHLNFISDDEYAVDTPVKRLVLPRWHAVIQGVSDKWVGSKLNP